MFLKIIRFTEYGSNTPLSKPGVGIFKVALVTIVTFPYFTALSAKVRPAIPEPITKKSVLFFITCKYNRMGKDTNRYY